jgi:hypothetical protein
MKILKAKTSHPKKQIFQISDLTYIKSMTPLKELLNGEEMIDPIQVIKHEILNEVRYGASGVTYKEKRWSVYKGSQRIQAALKLGYTHIEGIITNEC